MRDLPITLYPGAPPLIPIRGKPATDQLLNRGILQHRHAEQIAYQCLLFLLGEVLLVCCLLASWKHGHGGCCRTVPCLSSDVGLRFL